MLKRVVGIILCVMLFVTGVSVEASKSIVDSVDSLVLAAQHYYNTRVAFANITVSRPSEDKYEVMYFADSGKMLTTELTLTDWGTWNLANMILDDSGVKKVVMGGATDWEYVFRVVNPITQNLEFTGGNHGSEILNSIEMYDSVTGEKFTLEVGQSKYVNRLVVEEITTIRLADKHYLPYANVKRMYTFSGNTITLDSRVEFVRDVYMASSYTTMACIHKDFSQYCNFDSNAYTKTDAKGSFSNKRYGNVEAMVCTLNGEDTSARVTVGIFNKADMTDNFSNKDKVFIWDMSEEFNKLYFSKYEVSTPQLIKAGTVWNLSSFWKVDF